mgnify:CR=1 FL=1
MNLLRKLHRLFNAILPPELDRDSNLVRHANRSRSRVRRRGPNLVVVEQPHQVPVVPLLSLFRLAERLKGGQGGRRGVEAGRGGGLWRTGGLVDSEEVELLDWWSSHSSVLVGDRERLFDEGGDAEEVFAERGGRGQEGEMEEHEGADGQVWGGNVDVDRLRIR